MKTITYIYAEENKNENRDKAFEKQRLDLINYAKTNNLNLVKMFEEEHNAKEDFRPILLQMLNYIAKERVDKLLIVNKSIISKDKTILMWIENEILKHKIDIVYLEDSVKNVKEEETHDKKIKSIYEKIKDIPSLPQIVTRTIELIQDSNSSAEELSKVISLDLGLTTKVLKLVNSAFYGFPKQISSVQHALMILGFTTIRGLVISSSVIRIFKKNSNFDEKIFNYKKFWEHSLSCALFAKYINEYKGFDLEANLFASAILHDIGKVILEQYDYENYIEAYKKYVENENNFDIEEKFCGTNHAEIGYNITQKWNLPSQITETILYHHNPNEAKENVDLVCLINLANSFSIAFNSGKEFDLEEMKFDEYALAKLKMSEDDLVNIYDFSDIIQEELYQFEDFFGEKD